MTGGISIHAVDIASGYPAVGLVVGLYQLHSDGGRTALLRFAETDRDGMISAPNLASGQFEALFRVGEYYAKKGAPDAGFLEVVQFPFGIDDAARHHHLPLKFTPYGFSLFLTH